MRSQPFAHFILYVRDQEASTDFYSAVFDQPPRLFVPGMTEYQLNEGCVVGLMPEQGIKRLLGPVLPDPRQSRGVPRAELYLLVADAMLYHQRAVAMGAHELSGLADRTWGHRAAYSLDPDGHVLAFAELSSA